MFNDYARNMSKNIYDSKQERTGLKILTPKLLLLLKILLLKLVDKLELRSRKNNKIQ